MTRTRWIIFVVICLVVLIGLVWYSNRNQVDVSSIDQNKIYTAESGGISDHVLGKKDTKVLLIEYGDFQCPGCQSLSSPLKQIVTNYKGSMAFIFRNFPLTNIHPNALAAAAAAEAAGLQGKYFEMHDLLFQNQNSWKDASADNRTTTFRSYAEQLKLDVQKFEQDLSNTAVSDKIRRDQALARKAGADSTPTLVLNGEKLDSNLWQGGTNKLEEKIREVLKENGEKKLPKPINAIEE